MILQESTAKVIDKKCLSILNHSFEFQIENNYIRKSAEEYIWISDEEKLQQMKKIVKFNKAKYCLQGMDNSTIQGVNIISIQIKFICVSG